MRKDLGKCYQFSSLAGLDHFSLVAFRAVLRGFELLLFISRHKTQSLELHLRTKVKYYLNTKVRLTGLFVFYEVFLPQELSVYHSLESILT